MKLTYLTLIVISFFYFWDIGNVDAVRQGTEGFYLQVSKEMFDNSSFLTPLYHGDPHWSKPPLHFWSAIIGYFFSGGVSLWAARFVMALLSIWGMFSISKWSNRRLGIPTHHSLIFLATSLGMIKYSRIFMMEIDLTVLSVLGSLKFYDYWLENKKTDLIKASLLLGAAALVKGPVALVMCLSASALFVVYQMISSKDKRFRPLLLWGALSVLISSIWYILSYIQHGQQFFEYFFIRENMGKFTAKSYPLRTVFQGLLIYALPWSLYLPLSFFSLKLIRSETKSEGDKLGKNALIFVFINFLVFFTLWLIPNQRSHHYAMPSLPFFLTLIYIFSFAKIKNLLSLPPFKATYKMVNSLVVALTLFLIAIICLSFQFGEIMDDQTKVFKAIVSIIILLSFIVVLTRSKSLYLKFLSFFLSINMMWIFFLPIFYMPLMPDFAIKIIGDKKVTVELPRPFFVAQALQREVNFLPDRAIIPYIMENKGMIILYEYAYQKYQLSKLTKLVTKWPTWKRKNRFKDVLQAIKSKNLRGLMDYVVLLEFKGHQ